MSNEALEQLQNLKSESFETWLDQDGKSVYRSIQTVGSGKERLVLKGDGDDGGFTPTSFALDDTDTIGSGSDYRHVRLAMRNSDGSLEFENFPVKPTPYEELAYDYILSALYTNAEGQSWGITEGGGECITFFKKPGIFDHWVVAVVDPKKNLLARVAEKVSKGYWQVAGSQDWRWSRAQRTIVRA